MIFWVGDVNKKGNIDPIQKLILQEERTISAILFSYCHHLVLKIISSKMLALRMITQGWKIDKMTKKAT